MGIPVPKGKNYWVTPHDGRWAVKREGTDQPISVHATQADAWNEARRQARADGSEAVLQGRDGRIRERNTYGNDPYPPRG
jgi:hypothetical protein